MYHEESSYIDNLAFKNQIYLWGLHSVNRLRGICINDGKMWDVKG